MRCGFICSGQQCRCVCVCISVSVSVCVCSLPRPQSRAYRSRAVIIYHNCHISSASAASTCDPLALHLASTQHPHGKIAWAHFCYCLATLSLICGTIKLTVKFNKKATNRREANRRKEKREEVKNKHK